MDASPADHEAIDYARRYRGSFAFMRKMRHLAEDPEWVPTVNQRVAILRCRARETNDAAERHRFDRPVRTRRRRRRR